MVRTVCLLVAGTATVLMVAGVAAGGKTPAGGQRLAHPDLAGTRVLIVTGDVTRYAYVGGRVAVDWQRGAGCAGTSVWPYRSAAHAVAPSACQRPTGGTPSGGSLTRLTAVQGERRVRVVLAPAGADRADRLDVLDRRSGRTVASWPLIDRPTRVALYGDVAILSSADRHALYAIRLFDGRIVKIGVTRAGDRPVIDAAGVLYQDETYPSKVAEPATRLVAGAGADDATQRTVTLKLIPLATLQREFSLVGGNQMGLPIRTTPITAMAMDGPRVAFAVSDPQGSCDQVQFWNIPWHYVSKLTRTSGPTCLPKHAPGGITDVAVAGSRAIWTTRYGGTTRVLAASIIKCEEWVVARPLGDLRGTTRLAGDGNILAYALTGTGTRSARSSVGVVPRFWRGEQIASPTDGTVAVSVDSARVAALRENGTVSILTRGGALVTRVQVGDARAISLRRNTLAVLADGRLDVYSTTNGRRVQTWPVGAEARSVDLHFGLALVASGRDVYSFDLITGRSAHLLRTPTRVAAQLEAPGAAIQYNADGRGYVRFLPMSWIESRTR